MKPIYNTIVIKPIKEEKTKSGILLPDDGEKSYKGEIIAVADDAKFVKIGDTVIFKRYASEEVSIDGEVYIVLNETDIRLII